MKINKYCKADESITAALGKFIEECEKLDGSAAAIELDTSMNAVKEMSSIYTYEQGGLKALLSVFAPMRDEIEVSALVHPDHRNGGLFRVLIRETAGECSRFGYDKGLFVCASEAGRRVMEHWALGTDHVELQMSCGINNDAETADNTALEISKAQETDIDSLAGVGAAVFGGDADSEREFIKNALTAENRTQYIAKKDGRTIGLCAASQSGGSLMIYGLGVHPDERRKGYAQAILRHMKKEAAERGIGRLGLDVDEDNPAAIALYESYGFTATGRTEYYAFRFDDFK